MKISKKISAALSALFLGAAVLAAPQTVKADTASVNVSVSKEAVSVEKGESFDLSFTYKTPSGSDVRALKATLSYPDSKLELTNFSKTDLKETFDASTPAKKLYQYAAGVEGSMADTGTLTFTFKALADCTVAADEVSMEMKIAIDVASNQTTGTAKATVTFDHADSAKATSEQAATCVTDGYKKVTCTTCGAELSNDVIKADGNHHWVSTGMMQEATCKDDGIEGFKCDRDAACTATKEENYGTTNDHKWIVTEETDANGWKVTKEATETEKGSKERQCSVCEKIETAEIPVITPEVTPGDDKKPDDKKDDTPKKDDTTKKDNTNNTNKTNTTNKTNNTNKTTAAKTGDSAPVALYIVIMALAAAALAGFAVFKKRIISK